MRFSRLSLRDDGVPGFGHLVVSLHNFCEECKLCSQWITLVEVQVKFSVILMDCLVPDIFSTLRMKGCVLHRAGAHLKSPG